jgi:hypothetical protein
MVFECTNTGGGEGKASQASASCPGFLEREFKINKASKYSKYMNTKN